MKTAPPANPGREDRLKAALRANLARRKAQARARDGVQADDERPEDTGPRTEDRHGQHHRQG